jgi:hypothetical protein
MEDEVKQMTLPMFGTTYAAQEILSILFWPDQFAENTVGNDETPPAYNVTGVEVISGNFSKGDSACVNRTLVLATRMDIDAEYHDLFFLEQEADGTPKVADVVTYDGSQGQSETQLSVITEGLSPDKNCHVVKVSSSTEGGDINLHRDSWVEYFIADGNGFHSVLKVVLEETDVQDYEVSQDENKDSTSELREYKIATTSSHGLFDIEVHTTMKQNGQIISETDQTYKFDGISYH